MAKTLYFVAGEASADNHGAGLMRALRQIHPHLRFTGRGGPQMKTIAGPDFQNWIDKAGVVGLWEVVRQYGFFRQQFQQTLAEIERAKADAVVLIDYPGFNLRLAGALRRRRSAPRIIYYISPQVWAWNRGRIKRMAKSIDLMLCIFPFEAELYNQSGLRTIFVGHPMLERLRAEKVNLVRDPNLIGLFPGSRAREVRQIFPIILDSARELVRQRPHLQFEIAAASADLAAEMKQMLEISKRNGFEFSNFEIKVDQAISLMQRAVVGIVASGSATLEAAFLGLPFVLVYKVSWLTYFAGRFVVKVQHLGMPNVLANREIVPEFIQHRARPRKIAAALLRLLNQSALREGMTSDFEKIIDSLGQSGASEQAARAIIAELDR